MQLIWLHLMLIITPLALILLQKNIGDTLIQTICQHQGCVIH